MLPEVLECRETLYSTARIHTECSRKTVMDAIGRLQQSESGSWLCFFHDLATHHADRAKKQL